MGNERKGEADGFEFNPAIAAVVAVFVAVLAAVGLAGDGLTRAVRNHPSGFGWLLIGLIVVVGFVGLIGALHARRWLIAVIEALVVVALAVTVFQATDAVAEREFPLVSLSASTGEEVVTITVTARATGLASDSDMLLQVKSLGAFPEDLDQARAQCTGSALQAGAVEEPRLWIWEQAGPDSEGSAEVESSFDVPVGKYAAACAWASLRADPNSADPSNYRSELAIIRLNDVPSGPSDTEAEQSSTSVNSTQETTGG